ncbi:ChbG/HpnK family deacetylase [Paenibacillus sp. VCA1]|uniref:carbohydrate deacetylase n=1 Tax=Paenibacillus sp. VCA1 TaxID=3039148 RepID=UPI002871F391|nr:ChbG/HpnK family deacetylase [Paenibacillus sp. VCA1]MDR9854205.1 ChbG/HpnK family deacetylase [Paenibacillus sp. VCA1]
MSRQVIINADDFGLSPAVNGGIIRAYQAGGITSTSLMVNMPGSEDAVNASRWLQGLGIGLHFNLTYGKPLSNPASIPSLVRPDGVFHDGRTMRFRDAADVKKELDAQWNRMIGTGLIPTHLDSHHLLHQNDPVIYKVMAEKAVIENVPLRKSQIVHPLRGVQLPGMTDAVLLDTYGDSGAKQRLMRYLRSLPEGITEIVCHPGYVDDVLRGISEWTDIRERELSVFTDPDLAYAMQSMGIIPVNYTALKLPANILHPAPLSDHNPPRARRSRGKTGKSKSATRAGNASKSRRNARHFPMSRSHKRI